MTDKRYTLSDLSEKTGTPPRTIRYYIARGLLDGPDKAGRDAGYSATHVARIAEIKKLQIQGMTLAEISHELASSDTAPGSLETRGAIDTTSWRHYQVANDVVMIVREDAAPWRVKTITKHISQLAALLAQNKE